MTDEKRLFYPPGGILIWFIIILEMLTFLGAIIVFAYQRSIDEASFIESQSHLSIVMGTANTIVLITSGFLMAKTIYYLKKDQIKNAKKTLLFTVLLGVVFLIIKSIEYSQKIEHGYTFDSSTFFTFYWMLTAFHFVHVLFGIGLLSYMYLALKKGKYSSTDFYDIETSGIYWHMCDLIWILIFPILYLL